MKFFLVGMMGVAGVFSRYFLTFHIQRDDSFPLATLLINLTGSFLMGLVYALGVEKGVIPEGLRTSLMVGYLGGFTTFSSFCLDFLRLIEEGNLISASVYMGVSNLLGVGMCFFGVSLGRVLF